MPVVYEQLRTLAAAKLAAEPAGHSLQPTALVHEAYLRLAGRDHAWADRSHFLTAAARAMRNILVDHARRVARVKRGGGARPLPLDGQDIPAPRAGEDLLALDEALDALAAEDPTKARLVELRYFGGMTLEEAADALGISGAAATRHWAYAKAWLYRRLTQDRGG